jgi:hypothetical protein
LVLLAAIPLLLSLTFEQSHAYSRSKRYELSGPAVGTYRSDPVCTVGQCATSDKTINVGTVIFPPIRGGTTPTTIRIYARDDFHDEIGLVRMGVCQDLDRDGNCGEANEPNVDGCVKKGGYLRMAGTRRTRDIEVFVYSMWGCPKYLIPDVADRNGGGTTGVVKIVWY